MYISCKYIYIYIYILHCYESFLENLEGAAWRQNVISLFLDGLGTLIWFDECVVMFLCFVECSASGWMHFVSVYGVIEFGCGWWTSSGPNLCCGAFILFGNCIPMFVSFSFFICFVNVVSQFTASESPRGRDCQCGIWDLALMQFKWWDVARSWCNVFISLSCR